MHGFWRGKVHSGVDVVLGGGSKFLEARARKRQGRSDEGYQGLEKLRDSRLPVKYPMPLRRPSPPIARTGATMTT